MLNTGLCRLILWVAIVMLLSPMAMPGSVLAKEAVPPILLANVLGPQIDPTQYLVSEKFDGVRAIWDGKVLRFRSGRAINAPGWFIAKLPLQKLDGELWLAREKFEQHSGIVRKTEPIDDEWCQI